MPPIVQKIAVATTFLSFVVGLGVAPNAIAISLPTSAEIVQSQTASVSSEKHLVCKHDPLTAADAVLAADLIRTANLLRQMPTQVTTVQTERTSEPREIVPRTITAAITAAPVKIRSVRPEIAAMSAEMSAISAANLSKSQLLTAVITAETLEKWLRESGPALIKSFATREFPNVSAEQLSAFQIGAPVKAYYFTDKQDANGFPIISESNLRLAPISDAQGNAVGVIQVELETEATTSRQVFADAKLGQSILPPPATAQAPEDPETLVYDSALKAWFIVHGKSIEAASTSGEKVVLGAIPLTQFFTQRNAIVSKGTTATSLDQQSSSPDVVEDSRKHIAALVVILLMTGIFMVSITWLVWEFKFDQSRKRGQTQTLWNWATGHRRIVRSEAQETQPKKIKFIESSGQVTLYQKPEKLKQQEAQADLA